MAAPYRVMAVCTGNICRSPMAEVVLRDRFEAAGLGDRVVVDSTGVSDEEEGRGIDPRAASVLREHGYAVPRHRARQVTRRDLAERDLVLAMTARHARALRTLAPDADAAATVRMWRTFDPAAPAWAHARRFRRDAKRRDGRAGGDDGPDAVADETDLDVADPWYGGRDDFESTLQQVEAAAAGVLEHVRRELDRR